MSSTPAHTEAFALMWYQCDAPACRHRERLWNSRDGVTPFGLGCPSCGKASLRHVDWSGDVVAPDHKLNPYQRFFRDGTADEAVEITKKRIESYKAMGHTVPDEVQARLLAAARNQADEWRAGWPTIAVNQ